MSSDKKNNIQLFQNGEAYTKGVAGFIIKIANKAISEKGRFIISLSGGNTPNQLYSLLATEEYRNKISWKNTFIFWGDERCVPFGDKQNNAHMATSLLLSKIKIPVTNIYPVPVNFSPEEAAIKYEREINGFFKDKLPQFDLILLGLGENGHTASLFPATDVLNEKQRLVKEVFIEEQKIFRVTMTALLINQAHNIIFLVTGKEKASILKNVLASPYQPQKYPAQLIKPESGALNWFIDAAAAKFL